MANPPPPPLLQDYDHPDAFQLRSGILLPTTNANNYEFSPQLIRMIQSEQFGGSANECPLAHLDNFLELCTTIKKNNLTEEFIWMHMFRFSLRDKAKCWLRSVKEGSLTTWEEVTKAFLGKFFPPEKTAELRRKITSFTQEDDETLGEAWESFKDLKRKCPHHGLPLWMIIQSFYDGLTPTSRANLDNGAGGSLKKLPVEEAENMIEEVARHYAYRYDRRESQPKKKGMHELSAIDLIASKFDMLAHKLDQATSSSGTSSSKPQPQVMSCETCGGNDHMASYCNATNEQVAAMNQRNEQPFNQGKSNAEMSSNIQQLQAHNKIIENQLAQIAQQVGSSTSNASGQFPSSTVVNPKEHVKAITLRSRRGYEGPVMSEDVPQKRDEGVEVRSENDVENEVVEVERKEKEKSVEGDTKKGEGVEVEVEKPPMRVYKPPIPFPHRSLVQQK
ncbi:uncharacterized protein LOC110696908 [Chenopodium quinoa]|uniref:uncharacterized protein LOC110696908 n=1 Tax=Chenopodium quinoa TaxID=63459 RepID=UPI000B78692A|nr:uncharacterized protein LOC110696908 [Chenopodium quinoa]